MLKIRIIAIGKDKETWIADGCQHYLKLLGRSAKVELDILPGLKGAGALSPAETMAKEAELIQRRLDTSSSTHVVALTERGEALDSIGFSKRLQTWQVHSGGSIDLLIGGAFGLDPELLMQANESLSLSPLTFSHQLVRLVLLEQLYRGFSILQGSPYHK